MDKLKKHEYSMDSCNHCGQCKWILPPKMYGWDFAEVCPIHHYHGFDAYSGQGLLNISKEVITGRLKIGEGLEKVLYSCTACGACVKACPRSVIKLMPLSQNVIVRCRNQDVARVARDSCMRACIGCGRCKRECKYDAIIVENGFARIDNEKCTRCGDCAKVCPCNCITIE